MACIYPEIMPEAWYIPMLPMMAAIIRDAAMEPNQRRKMISFLLMALLF